MAQMLDDLLSKGVPGSKMPHMKVPGQLLKGEKMRQAERRLDKLGGKRNIVLFFTEGCSVCEAEKNAARLLSQQEKARIFMVNMDKILSSDPSLATSLFDAFDMSVLPFLVESDSSGTIARRYISLVN